MAMDLTVTAVPFYFGSMAAERRYLATRTMLKGPSRSDYTKEDTAASLAMGVGSLLAPFAAAALVKRVLPGKGRFPNVLVRTAVVATVATTIADRLKARTDRVGRVARKVARVGGPVAIATGGLAVGSTVSDRLSPARMWERNHGRDLGAGVVGWTAAVAGWDFIYYWNHRFMHEVRALWAIHVVHHSSERYNLSTALRQPVADVFGVFLPYGMLARVGVRPRLIAQARGINLLYQYWIHTDAIRRLGLAEEVLNTPSHHRVHHGVNSQYIDRNHGSILIVWDRLFGTFEREDEEVVYGLTKNINTYNPARIASHEHRDIVRDVANADTWRDRLSFVLRGPGWAYRRHAEQASYGCDGDGGAPSTSKNRSSA
jgi:sterol desaturase/sphingolipid hydroxylase (fatty acid hydroxylase superfamily)